jgi:signal transduction histidine kinase
MDHELLEHLKEKGQGTLELIHTMENFLLILSFDGKILLTSDSLFEKTNLEKSDFYHSKYYNHLYKSDSTPLNYYDLLLLMETENSLEISIKINESESPVETLVISSCILKNFFKDEDYILLLLADMREQRKVQMQLMHTNKMVSLGEMATNIAHEINNPITIIQGQLKMLERSIKKIDDDKDKPLVLIEKVQKNFARITKIIKSLRSVSRDDEKQELEEKTLVDIFEGISDLSEQNMSMNNIEFKLEGIREDQKIICSETGLIQVFLNLINNSIDSIKNQDEKWINININELEDEYLISVIDSGKGIPLEIQVKLFEPFYTTKDIGEGTGIGLSISRGLIEAHAGTLTHDNNSKNTCFKVKIPKRQLKEGPND